MCLQSVLINKQVASSPRGPGESTGGVIAGLCSPTCAGGGPLFCRGLAAYPPADSGLHPTRAEAAGRAARPLLIVAGPAHDPFVTARAGGLSCFSTGNTWLDPASSPAIATRALAAPALLLTIPGGACLCQPLSQAASGGPSGLPGPTVRWLWSGGGGVQTAPVSLQVSLSQPAALACLDGSHRHL